MMKSRISIPIPPWHSLLACAFAILIIATASGCIKVDLSPMFEGPLGMWVMILDDDRYFVYRLRPAEHAKDTGTMPLPEPQCGWRHVETLPHFVDEILRLQTPVYLIQRRLDEPLTEPVHKLLANDGNTPVFVTATPEDLFGSAAWE